MPVMSRLVYIVPNFSALDVSNTVADGFAVSWRLLVGEPAAGPGLCPAVLHRRIFHPEEPGGRRMRTAPNQNRKIIYGLVIVALFGAMIPYTNWLNKEKKREGPGRGGDRPGRHRQLHAQARPARRGAGHRRQRPLDPRRGAASASQDWDRMKATVDLITKLQPHFLSVWTFQGWNLAYNVSVEWDAPEDKYDWIKQGIKFLQDGVEKNQQLARPDLGHRLDLLPQARLRRRVDHPPPPLPRRRRRGVQDLHRSRDRASRSSRSDNFQLGYGWFSRAVNLVDEGESRLRRGSRRTVDYVDPSPQRKGRPGDLAFRSMPAHAQTRYAAGLEKMSILGIPATFGEVAKNEWAKALAEWVKFGSYTFMTPTTRSKNEQGVLIDERSSSTTSTNPRSSRPLTENQKYWTDRWADQMNYRYWKDRSQAEMTDEGVQARQLFYEGTMAYKRGRLRRAGGQEVPGRPGRSGTSCLKNHPHYRNDDLNKKDTGLIVKRYVRVAASSSASPSPEDLPVQGAARRRPRTDTSVDPFDATEMLGPPPSRSEPTRATSRTPRQLSRSDRPPRLPAK